MKNIFYLLIIFISLNSYAEDYLFLYKNKWTKSSYLYENITDYAIQIFEPLETKAKFDENNNLIIYTEYNGKEYICTDGSVPIPENAPKRLSILKILLGIRSLGKYTEFMTWLEENQLKEFLYVAQEFTTDHELFIAYKDACQDALNLTDEQVEALISSAVLPYK